MRNMDPKLQKGVDDMLARVERQSSPHAMLMKVMSRIAENINSGLEKDHGLTGLVDSSLRIDSSKFVKQHGGIYEQAEVDADMAAVNSLDISNSAADVPNTQKYYKDTFQVDTVEGIVKHHLESKEKSKSNQAEMAVTALLHKFLGKRFLVVRTNKVDDYKNGFDNLILDRETGAVICAFDEVLENDGDKERGVSKKLEKISKIAMKGGTRAKYGISLQNRKIVRSQAHNVPVFYLTLESKDLATLTKDLYYSENESTTEMENKIFKHLVLSIEEQKRALEALALNPQMKARLKAFDSSLSVLKDFVVDSDVKHK